jgi:hypothetical protein
MPAVLMNLTPGRRNAFTYCQKENVRIAVLPIMDVKRCWNFSLDLRKRAYRLQVFTCKWLQNQKYRKYRRLFTTQDKRMIVKYLMEVLKPFRYWTLWMSNRHTVTLDHFITVYNDMFDHMNGVMGALAKMETQCKEDLFFAVKLA